ncbi:MAG TPA: hypothetical protein VLX60_01345 [Terriglobales bacterium]|nr:hypothetical protein [Terriglobales bacterium]
MRSSMLALLLVAGLLAACGGSTPIIPPPPSGNFSNASLHGQYAFSMSGKNATNGAFIGRIGSIAADGNGHITSGLEDFLDLSSGSPASTITFSGGAYQIQQNGRGTMTLEITGGGSVVLSLALQSNTQARLVQADAVDSASGTLNLQTPLDFSANSLNGKYVFDFSGISFAGPSPSIISTVGQFTADGNGNVTGGTIDVNDGSFTPSGAITLAPSTYQIDTNGNGTNFGRGMLNLNGKTYAFYIVDNTRIKFLEEDAAGGSEGDAFLQTGAIPLQNSDLQGSFVFLSSGSVTKGNFGPIARLGRMTTDGDGGINTVVLDQNEDGNIVHLSANSGISNVSYSIDTGNAGSGRGTFTFRNSSLSTVSYVFYFYSPFRAVLQDVSASVVSDGTLLTQSAGPFTTSTVAGNFIFGWNGLQLINPSPFEENFVGQGAQTSASSTNFTGTADFTELGLTASASEVTLNAGISATLAVSGDGTQDNTFKVAVGGPTPFTVNFKAYIADNSDILLLCYDSTRTTTGVQIAQAQ